MTETDKPEQLAQDPIAETVSFNPQAVLDVLAPAMGLQVAPHQREDVLSNLLLAREMATVLYATPVDADAFDLAPVFALREAT